MVKVKAADLREKKNSELVKQLDEYKQELSQLRIAQVTNGAASKLMKIKVVRKNIARVLTVLNQNTKSKFRAEVKDLKENHVPKTLRAKKTRAIRRKLTAEQASKKTLKATKKAQNFPVRKYALKA
jgi:large subunit ribosomal protein L35e